MTGFSADWLQLREPFDHLARDAAARAFGLRQQAARWRSAGPGGRAPTAGLLNPVLSVLDLACGSAQRWRLVDHDPALLAAVPAALAAWAARHGHRFASHGDTLVVTGTSFSAEVTRQQTDLSRDLAALDFASVQLVTASALLDLVSATWFQQLVQQGRRTGTAMLFALNVDGRTLWQPQDPDDDRVHQLFMRHQRRDKGFGPALGPQSVSEAQRRLAAAGYQVQQAASDWVIDAAPRLEAAPTGTDKISAGDRAIMLAAMVDGMAAAAAEQDPSMASLVQVWRGRRLACLRATRLVVGHADLIATC
jgi:hypothetical protein